jgi:protease-4
MEGDGYVKQQIDRVRDDPHVRAIVLRVDSPGGTVTGSDYIYHHLVKLREQRKIPLVVSMGSMAASGGYYVAMAVGDQEKSIYAEPTTTTGSIGVIVPHYDFSGLMDRYDVKNDSVTSHSRKQMLSMTRSMSEEDRRIIQAYVDESFNRFKQIVKQGRPTFRIQGDENGLVDATTGRDLATGEIFTASSAQQYGLVDEIGFVEDAVDRAIELAGLDKERVRVVRYRRPPSLLGLSGLARNPDPGLTLNTLFELSAPRAYFLATNMPPLVRSRRHTLAD